MNWICPRCLEELGELNGYCEYCKAKDGTIVYNPDKYFIREIRIPYICEPGASKMTPQEELFSQLFNHEKILVKDMDTLTLRAHREELAKIAFEARARLTAADDEENDRKKTTRSNKSQGFERSVNTDESTTNAINNIKERQKRLTKSEKVQAGLQKLFEQSGMTAAEAEKEALSRMSAGKILERIKDKVSKDIIIGVNEIKPIEQTENKPFFNPFQK